MGSEQNDSTSFPPSEPTLCANRCGFFGTPSNMNLCSKCYRDLLLKEEQAATAKSAVEKSFKPAKLEAENSLQESLAESSEATVAVGSASGGSDWGEPPLAVANRCFSCNKKVGLTGFMCRCERTFCGIHRYPEKHECNFDFKEAGRDAIAKANPLVKADKIQRI